MTQNMRGQKFQQNMAIERMNETNNNDDAFFAKRNNVSYLYVMSEI